MQHLFSLQGSETQALWKSTVATGTYTLLKRFINRFCDQIAYIHQLEGEKLRLHPCHCRLTGKDGLLQAGADYN